MISKVRKAGKIDQIERYGKYMSSHRKALKGNQILFERKAQGSY
jgi:hypothetical protein